MPKQSESSHPGRARQQRWLFDAALLVVLAVLGGVGWLAYRHLAAATVADHWQTHSYQVIGEFNELLANLKDAETEVRGYVITGDEKFLEPYQANLSGIVKHLVIARQLTDDNPEQQARLVALKPVIAARLAELQATIALRQGHDFAGAQARVASGRGKQLMDDLRARLAAAEQAEHQLLTTRSAAKQTDTRRLVQSLGLVGTLAGLALLLLFRLLKRELARRHRVESALRAHEAHLLELVAERTRDLRVNEERLALAASGTRLGMLDWDLTTGAAVGTEQLFQLIGLPTTTTTTTTTTTLSQPYHYREWADRVHFEDLPRVEAERERCRQAHAPLEVEYRVVWPDGSVHWLVERGVFHYDAQDRADRKLGIVMDITARKQAEAALQASDFRLQIALKAGELGWHDYTVATGKILWDPNCRAMWGIGPDVPVDINVFWAGIHPDSVAETKAKLEAAIDPAGNGRFDSNYLVRPLDGSPYRWVHATGHTIFAGEGADRRPTHVIGTVQDITARKQAEEKLQRSEALYRAIGESIDYGVWVCDANGRHTYASPSFLKMVGITQEQCSNLGWGNVLHPDDAERTIAAWQDCVRTGGTWDIEHRFRGTDGQWQHVLARGVPVKNDNGDIISWAGINLDINRRKQAEAQYRELFTSMLEGFCVIDVLFDAAGRPVDYRFLEINPAFAAQTGLHDALGQRMRELAPDHEAHWFEIYGKVAVTGEAARFVNEAQALHRWFEVHAYKVGGADSRKVAILFNDITERKQAEEQIKASLAEKEVLLKEIHHRVKNNLQIIVSLVNLQADGVTDARVLAEFAEIGHRVRAMALVHEALYQTPDLAKLNFADYAARLLHQLWAAHRTPVGTVTLTLAVAPVCLPADTAVTCGLLLNELASNTLKHAFPNGRTGQVTVGLDHTPATGAACLWVRDDGIGLPADRDWRQAPSLGLRLVQMLTQQLRGTVATGPGPGAEFRVNFKLP